MEMVDRFLTRMYRTSHDFVFTVTRDFVRTCQTPVLILPDDIPAHPYAVAMEAAMLAPNAEVSMFSWKEPKERIPLAVRQIRSFLRAHRPASAYSAVRSHQRQLGAARSRRGNTTSAQVIAATMTVASTKRSSGAAVPSRIGFGFR